MPTQEIIHAVTSEVTNCRYLVPTRWYRTGDKIYWCEYPMPSLLVLYAETLMKHGHIRAEKLMFS